MTTNRNLFDFNGAPIRVVDVEGVPYFLVKDVCKALDIGNVTKATANFTSSEVIHVKLANKAGRLFNAVTEAGLYELVMQSRKPEAHRQQEQHVAVKARSAIP